MEEKEKVIGKSSARIAVLLALIAIVVAAFTVLPVLVAAAQGVEVQVNAPEYVAGTFNATIDVVNVTDLNSGQFDLSFNSSVVNVTDVKAGEIDGVAVPIFMWHFFDADTVRVLISMPMDVGANGSGSLAEIEFEEKGNSGEIFDAGDAASVLTHENIKHVYDACKKNSNYDFPYVNQPTAPIASVLGRDRDLNLQLGKLLLIRFLLR